MLSHADGSTLTEAEVEKLNEHDPDDEHDEPDDEQVFEVSACECQACADPAIPNQPLNVSESKTMHSRERKEGTKTYCRMIQTSWYKKYPWITVCSSKYRIFCASCLSARKQGLLTSSKRCSAFVDTGFKSWNKAIERFNDHEKGQMHKEATLKLAIKHSSTDIGAQLRAQCEENQRFHREMLMKLLSSIRYLSRQGLALRGHNESVDQLDGNLCQLLLLLAESDKPMKEWLSNRDYMSPDIVNELITIMGQSMLRNILVKVKEAMWYSIIADEATDVAHNEVMCISLRWVDAHYDIHEDVLGLVQLPDTKSKTLFSVIKDVLIRCSLSISMCRGQGYDGASNMSGIRNGVQALVKKECDRALYVHCLAHSLNLCVQQVSKSVDLIRNILNLVFELGKLIKFSPKRSYLFDTLRKQLALNSGEASSISLRKLCPTRWTVRHTAIESILLNYETLKATLVEVEKGHDDYAAKAHGMLIQLEMFDTFFGLKLSHMIFFVCEQYSINLQSIDITIQEATSGAQLLVKHLKSQRTESKFDTFYQHIVDQASSITEPPSLPRNRKAPRRFDAGQNPHQYSNPKDRFRHIYFEAIEVVVGEVERRFEQEDLKVAQEIECLLLSAANGNVIDISDAVSSFIEGDIDKSRLSVQLPMVQDMINTALGGSIKKTTNLRTIAEAMNKSNIYKTMLSEVDKLLKIHLTTPITSATAERSFSSLRRLKTFLRSTMTQCRLNNLFLLYIHTQLTDSIDLKYIAEQFIQVNSRRINYFGKF